MKVLTKPWDLEIKIAFQMTCLIESRMSTFQFQLSNPNTATAQLLLRPHSLQSHSGNLDRSQVFFGRIPVLTPYLLKLWLPNNYQNWRYWNFCLGITKLQASPCSLRNTGTKGTAQWVSMPAMPLWETEFESSEHERGKRCMSTCNPRAPVGRWKMETGESPGVGRPAKLAYTVEKQ